jgi:hypothetical protein
MRPLNEAGFVMRWRWGNVAARTKSVSAKASECRQLALIAETEDVREAYLRLARSYDALAAEPEGTTRPAGELAPLTMT